MSELRIKLKLLFESANQVVDTGIAYDQGVQLTQDQLNIVKKFVDYVKAKLSLQKVPKIFFVSKREPPMTTGAYDPATDTFKVLFGKRSLVDVLRTIAHELVHHMQKETGKFKPDEKVQDAGGPIEDEANAKAGEYIKTFVKDNNLDSIYDL